ncbi:Eco57I restriction-modification methylase domain-containing protein [Candidatus Oscillochloris fontis]|uniref:Eco57I restriction-modification methylase domain-containing protein n=1 Tax=Candidatus Oscillochloris fontis TaxID=2496868 RepID=UPI00101D8F6B|nr:N-6 DNA methylase [Candidatus Oscillochloris fontis]
MSASQLPLALVQHHANRQLFADRYLNETLPRRDAWRDLIAEATPVLAQVRAILAAFTPSSNESQTEREVVRPVLELLGHTFEVQASLRTPKGTKKPDYLFYTDQAALLANKNRVVMAEDLGAAFAVGDAKYWERRLDVSSQGEHDEINRVPSDQMAFYMRHTRVAWGILTNGRCWRLYHHESVERQDRFYEVDLKDLAEANDPEAFLYFYAFFRRAAFAPALPETLTLAAMLRESVDYARGLSESLKLQVFDALRHIAQGLLDYPRNRLEPTAEHLAQIYAHSLIVLYRLLFILYAEARELLPLRESLAYREQYSLYALVREVVRRLNSGMTLLADTGQTWARLNDLFTIINLGSPPLKVATFNGGLFDPQRHAFLDRYTVGDAQLQRALEKLARVLNPQTGLHEFIDYRDLAERHLGTIYEGLLEYHLVPVERGADGLSIELVNAKGERHRTGSYYTPDFVVQYIVEQTLAPALDAALRGKQGDAEQIAAVLGVNCVDPAMGSGHFLVAATEYMARSLVDLGVLPPAEAGDEADLAYWKRRVAQNCIYGVDLNPLAVDLAKLSLWLATAAKGRPLSFLDHHLRCGNALVGTRATELTHALAPKPNKRRKQVAAAENGQLSLLDDPAFAGAMMSAVGSMWLIEGSAGRTVDDVKEQERIYEQVRAGLTERFAVQADLVTASGFGLAPDRSLWRSLAEYASQRENGTFATPAFERPLADLVALRQRQRFFHWDLEFPEIFYDRHGHPLGDAAGFDVVFGNPPYVRQEELSPLKIYFEHAFAATYSGTADLFVYFFHQGIKLLRAGGVLGYISSNSWLRANYATPLRAFLRETVTIEQLIDLGDNRIFTDAPDVYPAIPLVRKIAPPAEHIAQVATFSRGEGVKEFADQVAAKLAPVRIDDQSDSGWQIGGDDLRRVFLKLTEQGIPLETCVDGRIYYGIKTGANDVFIIDSSQREQIVKDDPRSEEIIKPLLQGEDLRPWYQEDEGRWLILFPAQWTETTFGPGLDEATAWTKLCERYPSIAAYLEPFAAEATARSDKGDYWWELRACSYYDVFTKPRIYWPDIAKFPRFSWDTSNTYLVNTGYIATVDDPWILGYLSSRCAWFLISHTAASLGERAGVTRYRLIDQYMRPLPIPDAPAAEREAIGALALRISEAAKVRYALHRRVRKRISSDLGGGKKLNQRLTAWWDLDFAGFRSEVQKVFKRDIALKERDEWEEWLSLQCAAHRQHSAAIIAGERELNARVYHLFDLTPDEIALIEAHTKYGYGEV